MSDPFSRATNNKTSENDNNNNNSESSSSSSTSPSSSSSSSTDTPFADTPSFYRGFYDAEGRRPPKAGEDTIQYAIMRGLFFALPIGLLFWLGTKSARAASNFPNSKAGQSMFSDATKFMQQGMDPMGAKDFKVEIKGTSFKDVVGIPEAREEVRQYVEFLKRPMKFTRLGGRIPKGCLLTGEPGTGKTMLAKAVAGEASVPFYSCSGADFVEVFAGSGPKRVRELFDAAKAAAPAIIFIDEIDAVGSRSNRESAGNVSSEENRTVNQILAELDGMQPADTIVVFAATNYPDNLDKALLREGRFDRKVELPMPDLSAREEVFAHYLKRVVTGDPGGLLSVQQPQSATKKASTSSTPSDTNNNNTPPHVDKPLVKDLEPLPTNVNNDELAKTLAALTPGISPATVAAIVNEGALAAAIKGDSHVSLKRLMPAIDDVLVGKKHRNRMTEAATRRVALHESGHTLVAWRLAQQSKVIKVSITPRGNAAGFTQQLGREALEHQTDTMLFTDICVMLGGRAAELTQHDNLTTGASDDYQRATRNALLQCLAVGMNSSVGLLSFDPNRMSEGRMYQHYSETLQREAEIQAARLVTLASKVTSGILKHDGAVLAKLAETLYDKKELLEEDLVQLLGPRPASKYELHPLLEAALKEYDGGAAKPTTTATASGDSPTEKKLTRSSPHVDVAASAA